MRWREVIDPRRSSTGSAAGWNPSGGSCRKPCCGRVEIQRYSTWTGSSDQSAFLHSDLHDNVMKVRNRSFMMPGIKSHIYYFFRLRGMLYHGRKKEARGPGQKKGGQNVPSKTADKIAVEKWGSQWFPLAGEKCGQQLPAIGDG